MRLPVLLLALTASCISDTSLNNGRLGRPMIDRPGHPANVQGTESAPVFTPEKLYQLTVNFHDTFVYPHNLAEAKKINSTIFSEDCQGNIDITRTFVGRELNTEYVFGSFAQVGKANQLNLLGSPQTWNMTHWTGFQNNVNFAVTFQMFIPVLNITLPLEIWTWLSFNSKGEITQYDATFRYVEYYLETILTMGARVLQATSPETALANLQKALANGICETAESSCTGENTQYASYDACYKFLTSGIIPLGQPYQAGRNTVICRMIHSPMVQARPSEHCPHIGPQGGGMCNDDFTYVQKVQAPWTFFTNAPWLPRFASNFGRVISTGGPFPAPANASIGQ
ncbi:hypothetical protein E6O75_ATG05563 [Venturia nashicola]|uniref:Uncharacterized protein n=1 Tax=Venturia nashicola TaxID=86259 RepID=A0A4Z1P384_9PEZI|nr:hypothetical protein E6O75_ATG05563 [Venturia nashicola]